MREYKGGNSQGERQSERPWQAVAAPVVSFAEELRRRGVIVAGVNDDTTLSSSGSVAMTEDDNHYRNGEFPENASDLDTTQTEANQDNRRRKMTTDGQRPMRGSGGTQFRKGPHRWQRKAIISTILVIVVLALLYVLPIPLGTIQVVGSDKVTVQDVMAAGDIRSPVNLLQINTGRLEDRLANDLRVEVAKVNYVFPLTLQVNITDRKALAVVTTKFGFASIDKNGQVIAMGPAIEDTAVPIISGVKLGNILLGDKLDNKAIHDALVYLNALTPDGLKSIAEVNVGDENQLTAYTVDGLPLRLGDASELVKKAQLSEEMIKDVKTRGVAAQYLDVNVTSPFIKVQ